MRFRKKRKQNHEIEEFDITSLLDILVILLVFLLKSFNDSDLTLDLVNELALPYSMSRAVTNYGVILQVNKNKDIYVNTEIIGNMSDINTFLKLKTRLKIRFQEINKDANEPDKVNRIINFVFDKNLKFADINSIMEYTADSGFDQYKLIIQGEE